MPLVVLSSSPFFAVFGLPIQTSDKQEFIVNLSCRVMVMVMVSSFSFNFKLIAHVGSFNEIDSLDQINPQICYLLI